MAKDSKDLDKLKTYLGYNEFSGTVTRGEVSANTGITMKNLNRFLAGSDFEGVYIPETLENNNIGNDKIIAKV
jgi:phosphoglycerate dehydrogenase-like enzyme